MKKCRKNGKEALDEALLKVAVGYSLEEVTEEYAEVDGEMKLLKRKETKKDVPPDLKAVQILLADGGTELAKMSDEELEKERERLLAELEKKNAASAERQSSRADGKAEVLGTSHGGAGKTSVKKKAKTTKKKGKIDAKA